MKPLGHWTIAAANEHGWWGADRFIYSWATKYERLKELVHALHDAAAWQEKTGHVYSVAEILYD